VSKIPARRADSAKISNLVRSIEEGLDDDLDARPRMRQGIRIYRELRQPGVPHQLRPGEVAEVVLLSVVEGGERPFKYHGSVSK